MIQGLSGLCSVSVKPSLDTNICSHDCQGCGCARGDSSVAVAGATRKRRFRTQYLAVGFFVARYAAVGVGPPDDRAWSAAAGHVPVPSWRAERDEERVHRAPGGGVGAFVVDAVREREVALAEREADLDRVAVEGADLLPGEDDLALAERVGVIPSAT